MATTRPEAGAGFKQLWGQVSWISERFPVSKMALLDADTKAAWRYQEELPANAKNLDTVRQLLESYSNIPSDQVVAHITAVVCFSCQPASPL